MATNVGTNSARQYQGVFERVIPFVLTEQNFGSIAGGDEAAVDVTVTGAALGDFVKVAAEVDLTDLVLTASVTAADTVTIVVANNTGGAVDLASTTFNGLVEKADGQIWTALGT